MKHKNLQFGLLFSGIFWMLSTQAAINEKVSKDMLQCEANQKAFHLLDNSHANYSESCKVSTFTAYQAVRKNQGLLVDIRPQNQYAKVSIPESMNIPLHALKTKNILKNKKLYLVDEGGQSHQIGQICHYFSQNGFDVSYVEGGINGWRKTNQTLLGEAREILKLDMLGPEHFYFQAIPDDLLIVNIGSKEKNLLRTQLGTSVIFSYVHFPFEGNASKMTQGLRKLLKQYPNKTRLFVYDDNGDSYAPLRKPLSRSLKPTVFYLRGGYEHFVRFDAKRIALLKKQRIKPNHFFRCGG